MTTRAPEHNSEGVARGRRGQRLRRQRPRARRNLDTDMRKLVRELRRQGSSRTDRVENCVQYLGHRNAHVRRCLRFEDRGVARAGRQPRHERARTGPRRPQGEAISLPVRGCGLRDASGRALLWRRLAAVAVYAYMRDGEIMWRRRESNPIRPLRRSARKSLIQHQLGSISIPLTPARSIWSRGLEQGRGTYAQHENGGGGRLG